jgi:hypothetical protein
VATGLTVKCHEQEIFNKNQGVLVSSKLSFMDGNSKIFCGKFYNVVST